MASHPCPETFQLVRTLRQVSPDGDSFTASGWPVTGHSPARSDLWRAFTLPEYSTRTKRILPSAAIRKRIHFGDWPVYCRLSATTPDRPPNYIPVCRSLRPLTLVRVRVLHQYRSEHARDNVTKPATLRAFVSSGYGHPWGERGEIRHRALLGAQLHPRIETGRKLQFLRPMRRYGINTHLSAIHEARWVGI